MRRRALPGLVPALLLTLAPTLVACSTGDGGDDRPAERAYAAADAPAADWQAAEPSAPFAVRTPAGAERTLRGATLPELPRFTIDSREASTPSAGRRVHVRTAAELHAALRGARGGDVVVLAAGREFVGNFVIEPRPGAGDRAWITIRSDGAIPAEGTRATPAAARAYPRILSPNANPALRAAPGAHHYRVSGVELGVVPNVKLAYSVVALGDAGPEQREVGRVPHHLVLDRVYVHGTPALDLRRCVAVNSAWTAVVDSWLSECHSNEGDSQAIWGSNGPGPFTIVNNYLEGAGENVMFGGSDSRAPALMPGDITIRRNHLRKPPEWKGRWVGKNLFELKVGRRVLVEGNILEGSWVAGQTGFGVVIKSSNQEGKAPWSATQDLTFRLNRITRTAAGIQIAGTVEGDRVTSSTARVLVEQNLIDPLGDPALGGTGHLFAVGSATAPRDVVFRHNTGFGTNAALIFYEGITANFVFLDNVANGGEYRWSFSSSVGRGVGANALAYHAPGAVVEGNLFIDAGAPPTPPRNFFVANVGAVGFAAIAGVRGPAPGATPPAQAYALRPGSSFRKRATDSTDPGVDVARLTAATAGVAATPSATTP